MLAVSFSFLGDTLLLFGDLAEIYFMLGLVSFLLAHLFYVYAYRQHRLAETTNSLHGVRRIRMAFPILLAGTGLLVVLFPSLGPLKIRDALYRSDFDDGFERALQVWQELLP